MARVTLSTSVSIGGKSIAFRITREQAGMQSEDPTLVAAKAGQLTTRTNNTSGVVTSASHGFAVNAAVAIFAEGTPGTVSREGVISNTTTNTFTFSGCTGDSLPVVNTNVSVGAINTVNFAMVGTKVAQAAASAQRRASIEFQDAANAAIVSLDLGKSGTDGEGWEWHDQGQSTNPFTSNVARARIANGDTGNANQIVFGALVNTVS